MPARCVAVNCRNGGKSAAEDLQGRAITLHIFPKDPECRQLWALAVRRKGPGGVLWKPSRFSRLCSAHFTEDCFDRTGQTVRIRKGAVPTLFNFRKRLKRRALKPKLALNSGTAAGESQGDCKPSTMEEMTASRRKMLEALDKEHNYYCASSAKALKLALDKYLHTEDKLVKRLRNVKQRECRLRDRVSWLLMELEKKQLREESTHLYQLHSETGLGRIYELHPSQISEEDKEAVLLCAQQGNHIERENESDRKHTSLSEKKLNSSTECEARACQLIISSKQLRRDVGETACTCNEFDTISNEESALVHNQRTHTELNPRQHLHTCLNSGKGLRQSAAVTRKKLKYIREKPFRCRECGKSFSFLKGLRVHQQSMTCMQKEAKLETAIPGNINPETDISPKSKKSYQCSECGKCFSKITYVTRHQKVHTGEKPHTCTTCGKSFSQATHRIQHEKTHTREKTCTCSECGKSYRNTSDLNRHSQTHSEEKPYKCSECGKCFRLSDYLKVHQKIHTGETRCICSECGKCFSRVSYLKTHNRIHTGEKPYTCSECGKSFIDTLRLSRHQLTHRGKKPFQCTECGKSFRSKISLARHEGAHTFMNIGDEKKLEVVTNINPTALETVT